MAQIKISQLVTGTPKATDETPAVDVTDTTQAPSGSTKKYIRSDELNFYLNALGYITVAAAIVATTGALTVTYANGASGVGATLTNAGAQAALVIDGVTLVPGNRVLVKNQVSQFQNGIYSVTNLGSGSTNWVMTRTTDFDTAAEVKEGTIVLVSQGATYAGIAFEETGPGPFVIGTTAIIFTPFNNTTAGFTWNVITVASQNMTSNNGYITNSGSLVSLILPAASNIGDEIAISGQGAGGWSITQGAGQLVHIGSVASTTGVSGSVSSGNRYDSLKLVCITANTEWTTTGGPQGLLTIV